MQPVTVKQKIQGFQPCKKGMDNITFIIDFQQDHILKQKSCLKPNYLTFETTFPFYLFISGYLVILQTPMQNLCNIFGVIYSSVVGTF